MLTRSDHDADREGEAQNRENCADRELHDAIRAGFLENDDEQPEQKSDRKNADFREADAQPKHREKRTQNVLHQIVRVPALVFVELAREVFAGEFFGIFDGARGGFFAILAARSSPLEPKFAAHFCRAFAKFSATLPQLTRCQNAAM